MNHYQEMCSGFSADHHGVLISFLDPSYVHADAIILDRRDHSLHAVLYERDYFLGHITPDLAEVFAKSSRVTLMAPHHTGINLTLKAPLKISE